MAGFLRTRCSIAGCKRSGGSCRDARFRRHHLSQQSRDQGSNPFEVAQEAMKAAHIAAESLLEQQRLLANDMLRGSLGLEIKRAKHEARVDAQGSPNDLPAGVKDSSFWEPYAEYSPFQNRGKYLEQYDRIHADDQNLARGACTIVSEEAIKEYVDSLCEDGSLSDIQKWSLGIPQKTMYATVVKIVLRVIQTAAGMVNGQSFLGRQIYLLKRTSIRGRLHVSQRHSVDEKVVRKLVRRLLQDQDSQDLDSNRNHMSLEVQRLVYTNVVTLIFRLGFDMVDSFQLRVLGHSISLQIDPDRNIALAPGWDVPVSEGIFGQFNEESKRAFAADFVQDLLNDETINMPHIPDVIENKLYTNVVMVLLQLLETVGTHSEIHLAGMAFRPATDQLLGYDESE